MYSWNYNLEQAPTNNMCVRLKVRKPGGYESKLAYKENGKWLDHYSDKEISDVPVAWMFVSQSINKVNK